jgi:hypothetical protein
MSTIGLRPFHLVFVASLALLPLGSLAFAQDDEPPTPSSGDDESKGGGMMDIDVGDIELGDTKGSSEITYEGSASQAAPTYKSGTVVTITHTSGPIVVRCGDQPGLQARLQYTVYGSDQGKLQKFGDGFGIATTASTTAATVKTRVPPKVPGVASYTATLTVNLPFKASVSITGAQDNVKISNCTGTVKAATAKNGVYATGSFSAFNVSSAKGNVQVESANDAQLKSASSAVATNGDVLVRIPLATKATVTITGSSVNVAHLVTGANSPVRVQGTMNNGGPTLTITGKGKVEVTAP